MGDIEVVRGLVTVEETQNTTYPWYGALPDEREIAFRMAYTMKPMDDELGIFHCKYRIHGREFTDLSFMSGSTLTTVAGDSLLRVHEDGTKFIYSFCHPPTPTHDHIVWRRMYGMTIYCDGEGINMICAYHGYRFSQIDFYIGLTKSVPNFTVWLRFLDCDDRLNREWLDVL